MKARKYLFLFLLIAIVWSCKKDDNDDPEPPIETKVLLSATEIEDASADLNAVKLAFKFLSDNVPGAPDLSDDVVAGIKVYYIEYISSYADVSTITLSGLVCIPDDASLKSMAISFQNGTIVKHSSAPSENLDNTELMLLRAFAGLGYVIVIPDYIGFGANESFDHPYHYKPLFQSTVRDMLLAVQEMAQTGDYPFQLSGELFLTGYSLGGWASLVSHYDIEQSPIQGLSLIGSACGAGAYNLLGMKTFLFDQTNYVQPFYVPYLINSYQSVGAIEDNFPLYFSEPYASLIPGLFNGLNSSGQINDQLTTNMQELLSERLLAEFDTHADFKPLRNALSGNSQAAWQNTKPITLYHGNADINVPYFISENLYNDFVNMGQGIDKVQLITLEGADHGTGVMPMYIDVIEKLLEAN